MKINDDLLLSFGKIVVNKDLPKYKELPRPKPKEDPDEKDMKMTTPNESLMMDTSLDEAFFSNTVDTGYLVAKDLSEYISKADAKAFNILISGQLLNDIGKYRPSYSISMGSTSGTSSVTWSASPNPIPIDGSKPEIKDDEKYIIDVSDIFDQIHVEVGKEREFVERVRVYCELITKARKMGQVAQEEKLLRALVVHIYESVLAVSGFSKYIELKQLQDLQKKCKRLLDLDYLTNFTRIIPTDVAERKVRADELHVFDNYVVLHYDPTGAMRAMTEEEEMQEIRRKADPVLFGVIEGSTKLYYIGDWVDEYCDLTWDQIVEKIGSSELE